MVRAKRLRNFTTALAICASSASSDAQAGSASVGVSLSFDVAPVQLILGLNLPPQAVRSCKTTVSSIDALWSGRAKRPTLSCRSQKEMPLIVTATSGPALIARP